MLLVVAGGTLTGALGTVLFGHAGIGHDKNIRHALTGVVGGLVDNLLHVCCCCECGG